MTTIFSRKRASSLALAVALATGSAVVTTAVLPAEASAQRNRDRDKDEKPAAPQYSDEFRAVYLPLEEAMKDETSDIASMTGQFEAMLSVLQSPDEKIAGGSLAFNAGVRAESRELQFKGMQAMLESGKVPAEQVGRYNFIAYQLGSSLNDVAAARTYLQGAIDANFTTDTISQADLEIAMAETYFTGGEVETGIDFIMSAVAKQKNEGQQADEAWYRRGVTVAYNNEVQPQVYDLLALWLADYPASSNWLDAINIARNLNSFQDPQMLDLFRLSRAAGALSDASDYDYYVDAADARRLPKEVRDVINEGKAAGHVSSENLFLQEALATAETRVAQDRADLPSLEKDANDPNASLSTVVAAGATFLSYGDYAKAAKFYERALGMPGVETNEVLNRLGIAQIGLGDYAAARETLAKVSGVRAPIAKLWTAYANQLDSASNSADTSETSTEMSTS